MFKYTLIAFFIVSFSSCASSSDKKADSFQDVSPWDASPTGGELIFIGVSSSSRKGDVIQQAVEDAAKKVADFYSVEGLLSSQHNDGNSRWDYEGKVETTLNSAADYKKYVDSLSYDKNTDVSYLNNTVFVKTRYKGALSKPLNYSSSSGKEKPAWINKPPKIAGYVVGVGYEISNKWLADTLETSRKNALRGIIESIEVTLDSNYEHKEGNSAWDSRLTFITKTEARLSLSGFYVLDFWIEPNTNRVYTLAIANEVK